MPNSLIDETSPYLLQHAHNPVNWYAWNDQSLQKAKDEKKMLLISIGYAACHWCHVMEHECFEDKEVAFLMNKHFVCIKVDREERPDVDQVYMDAATLINGTGGWPLNALALPNGQPFFAGTYYPKENWIRLLEYFAEIYINETEKLEQQAANLSKGINDFEKTFSNTGDGSFEKSDLDEMFFNLKKRIDWKAGGMQGSMKFPMPAIWEFLLQYHYFSGSSEALESVETTLKNMACGGIYDQVGGGFSRYTTDSQWHVPHFEKMLYDNGQLVSLYSHAFQLTKKQLYKKIVYETLEFVNRELTSPEGGFYSSLDADSDGGEGNYYVWNEEEIAELLQNDKSLYASFYGITPQGNWEHQKNIPDANYGEGGDVGKKYGLTETALQNKLAELNKKLLYKREQRIRPATDDKILTSWNSLMAKGFIDAYKAFGEKDFLSSAKKNIDFLLKNICTEQHSLYRNYKNGKATIFAFLDDYAFLIAALIEYYQVSFDERYLQKAKLLTQYTLAHFFDKNSGMFFYSDSQHSDLFVRKMETTDNVIPSSNSEMAKNLYFLSKYFENENDAGISTQMIKNIISEVSANAGYYSNWASAASLQIHSIFEIAIIGNEWKDKLRQLHPEYMPGTIFMGGERKGTLPLLFEKGVEGKTMIYVCKNKNCGQPVENVKEALQQILNHGQ